VRSDVSPDETATFMVAAYEGYISLAKNAQDVRVLQAGKRTITTTWNLFAQPAGTIVPRARDDRFFVSLHTD
jgi:hypothetical protein